MLTPVKSAAVCNRICTVQFKQVAQVKNLSVLKFVRTRVKTQPLLPANETSEKTFVGDDTVFKFSINEVKKIHPLSKPC